MKKKYNYSKIGYNAGDYNDLNMSQMAKAGNESINGLIHKCVAVKKRRCR